jgi:predicted glycosyltransferase involved in capsule biosynthesis
MEKDIKLDGVKKIFTPKPFESSRANNIGASMATTNIFIFQDADIIFRPRHYDEIMQKVKKGYEMVRVGEKCVNLNTQSAIRMSKHPEHIDKIITKKFKDSFRDAPGACIAITRKAFVRIGGYCELFKVYGWEDCYFRYKANKLTKKMCLKEQMIHLPHETNFQMKHQAKNAKLYHDILYTDNGNAKKLAARDREDLLAKYPGVKR